MRAMPRAISPTPAPRIEAPSAASWRRLRDWQMAGVWDLIHFALLEWRDGSSHFT